MALAELDKIKILRYLGWPARTIDSTSISYSKIVSDRLSNLSAAIESETRFFMNRIAGLDEKLDAALTRVMVTKFDDISINPDEINIRRKERNKVIRELATLLDIAVLGSSSMGNVSI